jgi:hypothetical protein
MLSFHSIHSALGKGTSIRDVTLIANAVDCSNMDGIGEPFYLQGVTQLIVYRKRYGHLVIGPNGVMSVAPEWFRLFSSVDFSVFFLAVFMKGLPTMRLLELLDESVTDFDSAKASFDALMLEALGGRPMSMLGAPA